MHRVRKCSILVRSSHRRNAHYQIMRNWEPWETNIGKSNASNNHRMIQQLAFHQQQSILNPSGVPVSKNLTLGPAQTMPTSPTLAYEMEAIEPGENPSRTLTSKPTSLTVELHTDCMTTSFVCCSYMFTVKHLLCPMNSRRNRISFVPFEWCVSLI